MKAIVILLITILLAFMSQMKTLSYGDRLGYDPRKKYDVYLILLMIFFILICGLRTAYNDTQTYALGFRKAVDIKNFLSNKENLEILNNPLFYGFQSLIKTFTSNVNVFFMICSIIVNFLNIRFIKRYSEVNFFAFSMFIYVTMGILILSCAAQKQSLAMAILTLALPKLFEKKYFSYYTIVFFAGLIHTYAWIFIVLPLLYSKPWTWKTFTLILLTVLLIRSFQPIFTTLLEAADQIGKNIPYEEVFDNNQMNILRVAVFSVLPFIILMFRGHVTQNIDNKYIVCLQMSIVAMLFMWMGTQNGANMFGRCGNYFIMGIILGLPWAISQIFNEESTNLILSIAALCFIVFYYRDSRFFEYGYSYISLLDFIKSLI